MSAEDDFPEFPFMSSSPIEEATNQSRNSNNPSTSTSKKKSKNSNWKDDPFSPFAASTAKPPATDQDSHDGTAATVATSTSHTSAADSLGFSSSKNNSSSDGRRPSQRRSLTSTNTKRASLKMGQGDTAMDDLTRSLDEAFAKGPTPSHRNNNSNSGKSSSSRRTRASSPHGDKSVGSHGSHERRSTAPGRGLARQRSQKRASIAAAVSLMATSANSSGDGGVDEQVSQARAERTRIPRRNHADRLHAAATMGDMNQVINLGYGPAPGGNDNSHHNNNNEHQQKGRRGSRGNSKRQEEPFSPYDDFSDDNEEFEEPFPEERKTREKRGGRRPRRASNDNDANLDYGETPHRRHGRRPSNDHDDPFADYDAPQTPGGGRRSRRNTETDADYEYGDQGGGGGGGGRERDPARRSRFSGKGACKSFDDSIGNMRARRGRRASMMGGSVASENTEKSDYRTRAGRRRASMMGDGVGGGGGGNVARGEPAARGVRENLSGRRRRATMSTSGGGDPDLGYGDDEPEFGRQVTAPPEFRRQGTDPSINRQGTGGMDDSQMDDHERQQRQTERANKQSAMLERLRKSKEEKDQPPPEETSLDGLEGEPEPEPEPEAKSRPRRRASLGIPKKFGMSATNFASFDPDEGKKEDRRKENRRVGNREKPERTGKTPSRAKSSESGITAASGGTGRARAADTDRRRRGTMMERIGG